MMHVLHSHVLLEPFETHVLPLRPQPRWTPGSACPIMLLGALEFVPLPTCDMKPAAACLHSPVGARCCANKAICPF